MVVQFSMTPCVLQFQNNQRSKISTWGKGEVGHVFVLNILYVCPKWDISTVIRTPVLDIDWI